LGLVYERLGRFDEATRAYETVSPAGTRRGSTIAAAAAVVAARAGRSDEARATFTRLEAMSGEEYVSAYDLAIVSLALGDDQTSLHYLGQALDQYASSVPYINIDARFDPLRADPRFHAIVERLKFPHV